MYSLRDVTQKSMYEALKCVAEMGYNTYNLLVF